MRPVLAMGGVLLLAAVLPVAAQQSVTLTPSRDTSIFNDGTPGSHLLADGSGDYLWTSVTAGGLNRRALVQFDLRVIPPGARIQQVTLTLYESRARDEHSIALHRLLASWGEGLSNAGGAGSGAPAAPGDATWTHRFFPNTLWATPGGVFVPDASAVTVVGLPNTTYSWGGTSPGPGGAMPRIVQDVKTWVDDPAANHGWVLVGVEDALQNAKRFESRDNALESARPRLTVVYWPPAADEVDVPIPPWALAGMALALVLSMIRSDHGRRRG